MKLKDLYAEKRNIFAQMNDLRDRIMKGEELDPETKGQFDGLDAEYKAVEEKIKTLERTAEIEAMEAQQIDEIEETKPKEKSAEQIIGEKRAAVKSWLLGDQLTSEQQELFGSRVRKGEFETRVQNVGTTTAGGFTIAQDFSGIIETLMAFYGPFANKAACYVLDSPNGADMKWPVNDDTSNTGALLAESGDASSGATDLVFAVETLKAYKMSSELIVITQELVEDSYFNILEYVGEQLATRLGRVINTYATTGTGSSQPEGATIGSSSGKVAASATAITFSEMIDLKHSVDKAYRGRPLTGWMLHDTILAYLKKVSIALTTQTIWQPSLVAGTPDLLDGDQFWVNNDMASGSAGAPATGEKSILYGDFSKFVTRWVTGTRTKVLNERYGEKDQIGIVGFQRFDSRVINTGAIKYLEQT